MNEVVRCIYLFNKRLRKKNGTKDNFRTTTGYTLEDDIVSTGKNCEMIAEFFGLSNDSATVAKFLKSSKADNMLDLCNAMQDGKIIISIPEHITSILFNLKL